MRHAQHLTTDGIGRRTLCGMPIDHAGNAVYHRMDGFGLDDVTKPRPCHSCVVIERKIRAQAEAGK